VREINFKRVERKNNFSLLQQRIVYAHTHARAHTHIKSVCVATEGMYWWCLKY